MLAIGAGAPFLTPISNPPGCKKPIAKAVELNPDSFCQAAVVQVIAQKGTEPYTFAWNGGAAGADDTMNVPAGTSGFVIVTDDDGQVAHVTYETKARPHFRFRYEKENFCSAADPDETGVFILKDLEHGIQGSTYTWAIDQTYDAQTETKAVVAIANSTFVLDYSGDLINETGLTPGNYLLTVTDVNGCVVTMRFTICDSCTETSSDYEDQVGGCGCCGGADCVGDTSVSVDS